MGMHGNTPGYAICTQGSFRMSLAISESWLSLTKQAWKSFINFVFVSPERLSSLWQGHSVGCSLAVALKECNMHMQMASTFNLMEILENVYLSDRQLKIKL